MSRNRWITLFQQVVRRLRQAKTRGEARRVLMNTLNAWEGELLAGRRELPPLEYYTSSDCVRVLKRVFSSRNERRVRFSAVAVLHDAAQGKSSTRTPVGEGFWQEILHLFLGAKGDAPRLRRGGTAGISQDDRPQSGTRAERGTEPAGKGGAKTGRTLCLRPGISCDTSPRRQSAARSRCAGGQAVRLEFLSLAVSSYYSRRRPVGPDRQTHPGGTRSNRHGGQTPYPVRRHALLCVSDGP